MIMKNSKEYKGIYFSNYTNSTKNSDNILIKKKLKKTFFENGAHFKYSSLCKELQKLFKIQNYSLPKKKIRRKKNINFEYKITKPSFIYKLEQIKNKNRHNVKEKFDKKNISHTQNITYNKQNKENINYTKSQTITYEKKLKYYEYSSINSGNNLSNIKNDINTIKIKKNNKSKIFYIKANIKKKRENRYLKNNDTIKNKENTKYSASFIKTNYSVVPKNKNKKNLKIFNNNLDINKNVIKVKTRILTPTNKDKKIQNNQKKLFIIEGTKENHRNYSISRSFINNTNKVNFKMNKEQKFNKLKF